MQEYHCSVCGAGAYYDGRCGDGPVLMCGCNKGEWINDGRGGYYANPTGARAVPGPTREGVVYTDRSGRKVRRKVIIIEEYED